MSFADFFQNNILLFGVAIAVFAAIIVFEYKSFQIRGSDLSSGALSQSVNSGAVLIDLRSESDFSTGHIAGAKNIPFETLPQKIESLGDKEKAIVFYCALGNQSTKAINECKAKGYTSLCFLKGGFSTWQSDNLPIVMSKS